MTENSLTKVIRANSWRLAVLSTLFLVVFAGLGVRVGASMVHAVRGPLVLSPDEFVTRLDAGDLDGQLVDIRGASSVDSGLHHDFGPDGTQHSGDPVSFLTVGDRVVPVRTATPTDRTHFVGIVGTLDNELGARVQSRLAQQISRGTKLSPLAIDATVDHEARGRSGAALLAFALSISAFMCCANLLTLLAPSTSRAMRALRRRYGRDEIELASVQLTQTHLHLARLHVTRRWIVGIDSSDRFVARPMSELVWCYRKVVTSRVIRFLMPGRRHLVVMVWADGKRSTFGLDDEAAATTVTAAATKFAPWAASGYTEELQTMWSRRRSELLASVEERKERVAQFNMVDTSEGVVWHSPDSMAPTVGIDEFVPSSSDPTPNASSGPILVVEPLSASLNDTRD